MPLAFVEGSPALKFFKSVICLSTSTICLRSFSSWFRTEATYCGFAVLGAAALGLAPGVLCPFPTTEILPVELDKSSLVKTFLGFFASAEVAGFCGCDAGGGELGSAVWAAAGSAAKTNTRTGIRSERGTDPPVFQSRGPILLRV